MTKIYLSFATLMIISLVGCTNSINNDTKDEFVCYTKNDCVLKPAPYCCGEELEFVDRCFHKDENPPARDCGGNDMCPGIKQTLDCACKNGHCIDIYE